MDIASRQPDIDPEATVWEDVKIGGMNSGLRLQVRSADHPDLRKLGHKMSGRMIRQGVLMKGMTEDQQDEVLGRSQEEAVREQAVGVTVGWEWGKDADGEPFTYGGETWDFSPENARRLFAILPEAVEAANTAASKTANFTKPSSKSSQKRSD
jgi:hypothetical protein